ncbi:Bicaudal D-related protein 1, partial [Operophtera brumata]
RDEEKASLIAELTAQNSRLTTQLKESSATEANLIAQLEGLKDHDKRADLERRITSSMHDKDNLMQQLDEANDRI